MRLISALVGIGVAGLMCAPHAAAEPDLTDRGWAYADQHGSAICRLVDADPTVETFVGAVKMVGREGFSAYEASGIVIAALSSQCPQHHWLVDAFIDATPPPPPVQVLV